MHHVLVAAQICAFKLNTLSKKLGDAAPRMPLFRGLWKYLEGMGGVFFSVRAVVSEVADANAKVKDVKVSRHILSEAYLNLVWPDPDASIKDSARAAASTGGAGLTAAPREGAPTHTVRGTIKPM